MGKPTFVFRSVFSQSSAKPSFVLRLLLPTPMSKLTFAF
jgi:hypothetical protein